MPTSAFGCNGRALRDAWVLQVQIHASHASSPHAKDLNTGATSVHASSA